MGFILYKQRETMSNIDVTSHLTEAELKARVLSLQQQLHQFQLSEQKCQRDLSQTMSQLQSGSVKTLIDKIYNPLTPPDRRYVGLNTPVVDSFQMIGFVYKNTERFPLFGRYKYPGRSDKWEYYVMDESRNHLKIPFKSVNDNELYDADEIDVPTVGKGYQVKMYDLEQFRYNPNL
jgi:hypothetical protein